MADDDKDGDEKPGGGKPEGGEAEGRWGALPDLPDYLRWAPRFDDNVLRAVQWFVLGLAALLVLAAAVLYYVRSADGGSPGAADGPGTAAAGAGAATDAAAAGVARAATDLAALLLVSGLVIVLVGVFLVLGEVVKVVPAPTARRDADRGGPLDGVAKVITATTTAARGLTPGRLLVVVGIVPMILAAWVAQSATSVSLETPASGATSSATPTAEEPATPGQTSTP